MRPKPLYLEQRIAIAHRALNERTMEFQELLQGDDHRRFLNLVLDIMATLEGDRHAAKRLARRKP